MERVYKCDFCGHTEPDFQLMLTHEKNCAYDVSKKTCSTCRFQRYDGYPFGGPHCCDNDKAVHYNKDCETISPEDFPCDHWKN